jgi:hypothetical protein
MKPKRSESRAIRNAQGLTLALTLVVLGALTSACESQKPIVAPSHTATLHIQDSEFGEEWPFTVSEGVLECVDDAVIFHTHDGRYALNGLAFSKGYIKVDPIRRIDPLRSGLAEYSGETGRVLREVASVSLGPVIIKGLELCD